ncbi:MAG: LacI family DNA-binding transcriptional regulator [Victivallales bacterium]
MISLKTIAQECGVSAMTVSRALDENKRNQISAETRKKILEVAEKNNYRSNKAACSLRDRKTYNIMLFTSFRMFSVPIAVPDFDAHFGCLVGDFLRGVISTAHEHNYDVKLEPLLRQDDNDEYILPLLDKRLTDGVIFQRIPISQKLKSRLQAQNIPFVREAGAPNIEYDCTEIYVDKQSGFYEAFEYLCKKNHRKIAYIGDGISDNAVENLQIFSNFFKLKKQYDPKLIYTVKNFFELQDLLNGLSYPSPFSALVCQNDCYADFVVRTLRKKGIRVPADVAVIGFDNNPAFVGEGRSNLTTIDNFWKEKGEECFNMLYEIIKRGANSRICKKSIPSKLILRETA